MTMTWTTLNSDLGDYTANTSAAFVAKKASFIELAESRLRRDLFVPDQIQHVTGQTFTANNALLTLESDFVRFDSLFY